MGQEWIFYARFMEFSKFEVSRNSGLKHRQELLCKFQHRQVTIKHCSISASLPLLETWQSESLNTSGNVFCLGNISPWASTVVCQGCRQRLSQEKPHTIRTETWKTSPTSKLCQKVRCQLLGPAQRNKQIPEGGKGDMNDCVKKYLSTILSLQ